MTEYHFTLKFALPDAADDPDAYLDRLFEAGCDDALVGVGQHGSIGLDFSRQARDATSAVSSAMSDVQKAIPAGHLIEVSPDLVGTAEIAKLLGCSRQNIRKVVFSPKAAFPPPAHTGGHASLWHLVDVLQWAAERKQHLAVADAQLLYEVASASVTANVEFQFNRYNQVAAKANTA